MPLTASTLKAAVVPLYQTKFPTCIKGKFPAAKGGKVVSFELLDVLCKVWCDVVTAPNLFQVAYAGVTGTTASAIPSPFTFPATAAGVTSFLASSGWTGTASINVARSFIEDIAFQSSALGLISFLPVPAAGPGVGLPSPSIASSASLFVSMFQAAFKARFAEKIGLDGLPLFNLSTAQLNALIINLSNSYATIVASITFTGAFAGAPTVPAASPLSVVTSGSIV